MGMMRRSSRLNNLFSVPASTTAVVPGFSTVSTSLGTLRPSLVGPSPSLAGMNSPNLFAKPMVVRVEAPRQDWLKSWIGNGNAGAKAHEIWGTLDLIHGQRFTPYPGRELPRALIRPSLERKLG